MPCWYPPLNCSEVDRYYRNSLSLTRRGKFLPKEFVHSRGVRLSARGLHHRSHEEAKHRGLSTLVLFYLLRVCSDHFFNDLAQCSSVADLPQPLAVHDRGS